MARRRRAGLGGPGLGGLGGLGAAVAWHRRLLAAGLAAASVAVGLSVVAPDPPRTVPVLAASRDLEAGVALGERDVAAVALPPGAVPDGVLRPGAAVLGRAPAGPVRRGEPLTDVRLVGPGLLEALGPGLVATPVRIADAGSVRLLRPGDRVDVLAARAADPADSGGAASASPVVAAAPVLSVPSDGDGGLGDGGLGGGALVVLATGGDDAAALAAAAVDGPLSVVLRSGG